MAPVRVKRNLREPRLHCIHLLPPCHTMHTWIPILFSLSMRFYISLVFFLHFFRSLLSLQPALFPLSSPLTIPISRMHVAVQQHMKFHKPPGLQIYSTAFSPCIAYSIPLPYLALFIIITIFSLSRPYVNICTFSSFFFLPSFSISSLNYFISTLLSPFLLSNHHHRLSLPSPSYAFVSSSSRPCCSKRPNA